MRKLILGATLLAITNLAYAGVVVEGRGTLELGADLARETAISEALIEASYRNNAYVSSVTEVQDFSVKESNSLIKTSSLIESYEILDEYECGTFYCVELEVEYGDKVKTVVEEEKTFIVEVLSSKPALSVKELEFYEVLETSLRQKLNGFNNLVEVESELMADYKISIVLDWKDVERNWLAGLLSDAKLFQGVVVVNTRGDVVSQEIMSDGVIEIEGPHSDGMYSFASKLRSTSFDIIKNMPLEGNYVVGNVEGKNLFIKSKTLEVGAVFEVIFEDLKTQKNVTILGFVESVYKNDALVKLKQEPLPSYRLRRLTKIAQ